MSTVEALAASLTRKGIITMATTTPQALIREGAEAANLMPPSEARDLIARLTHALESVYTDSLTGQAEHARWQERAEELEAIVNDGGNQAAKYWTRLTAAEQERDRYRELTRRTELQCQDAETEASRYREAIEAVRKYIHSDKGIDLSEMAPGGIILGILDSALNDKEAEE